MNSRRHDKFIKIGKKKNKRRNKYLYLFWPIILFITVVYSMCVLIINYRQEKKEFVKETTEVDKGK